jgi:hypothetical protein
MQALTSLRSFVPFQAMENTAQNPAERARDHQSVDAPERIDAGSPFANHTPQSGRNANQVLLVVLTAGSEHCDE